MCNNCWGYVAADVGGSQANEPREFELAISYFKIITIFP
jgi:hypothetical protein